MPYIPYGDREQIDMQADFLLEDIRNTFDTDKLDGVMNYVITYLLKGLYPPKYFNYNRAIGMLECVKQEFYRRMVAPYEDTKIEENGDV